MQQRFMAAKAANVDINSVSGGTSVNTANNGALRSITVNNAKS
jgi:hypothetical protein